MNEATHTPKPTAADVRALVARETALPSRLAYTALLLAGLGGAVVTGSLALTEPGLATPPKVALLVLAAIGLEWAIYAAWVLARRRVLLAGHRVVAARMAIAFTAVFTLGTAVLGMRGDAGGAWPLASLTGLVMLVVAVMLLMRARRRVEQLNARRRELEDQLGIP